MSKQELLLCTSAMLSSVVIVGCIIFFIEVVS